MPSLTFVATANAVRYVRATPVFCDIRGPNDLTIDPEQIDSLITDRTRAIVVMHYGGFPCDMDRILELARKHRLRVVEDACHGPLSEYRGRKLGTIGDIGCFSFFDNKNISTGEGGMLVTDDATFAEQARLLRSHGMTSLSYERASGHSTRYDVVESGYNYRMDDIHAALGIVQLGKLRTDIQRRANVRNNYLEALETLEGSRCHSATVRTWYRTTSSLWSSRARTPPGETRYERRCTSAGFRRAFTTRQCTDSRASSHTAGRFRRPSASRTASLRSLCTGACPQTMSLGSWQRSASSPGDPPNGARRRIPGDRGALRGLCVSDRGIFDAQVKGDFMGHEVFGQDEVRPRLADRLRDVPVLIVPDAPAVRRRLAGTICRLDTGPPRSSPPRLLYRRARP